MRGANGVELDAAPVRAWLHVEPDGRFSGRCGNAFAGSLRLDGDRVVVLGLGGHRMLYDALVGRVEEALALVLRARPEWTADGDALELREPGGMVLRFRAGPTAPG